MPSPFLYGFSGAVIQRLLQAHRLEICDAGEGRVVAFVAAHLESVGEGGSLISALSTALIRCPEVEELYADEGELKDLVQDLGRLPR